MSRYRIQYAPPADQARHTMPQALRAAFDAGMQRLAADPYGHGSTPVKDADDRREATINTVVIRYYVSDKVTVVRIVYL
ncbi:hypothetical protein ACFWNG_18460 [Streptomyces sp. NPDC058391]|uniref:hypothetical protein n=1 Tax=Streptomyces sp. NPDC058391 TaxID=3346476 RepID=UPI0036475C36